MGGADRFGAAALRTGGLMARIAGWTPETFWAATPAEAAMVLAGWNDADDAAIAPPDAALRAQMMEQFPDERADG